MKITIRNKKTFKTKNRKNKEIPISNELYNILQEYLKYRYKAKEGDPGNILPYINPEDYLFVVADEPYNNQVKYHGNKYTKDSISQHFRRVRNRANLPAKYHFHCLRH